MSKISFENVNVSDKKQPILNGLNFTLEDNKIVGLLGRNGSGKTTLLSLIASYRKVSKGKVLIDGEIAFEDSKQMSKVLFISGNLPQHEEWSKSIKNYVPLYAKFYKNFDESFAFELIKKFDIDFNQNYSELSKGQKAAVNISIGLASRAEITIFDEAYAGLDEPSRNLFYEELLKDFENHPRLIIMSTHLIAETDYLFEEVLFLREGKVLLHESYDKLQELMVTVSGPSEAINEIAAEQKVLHTKSLGQVKEVILQIEDYEEYSRGINKINPSISVRPASLPKVFNYITEVDLNGEQ